MRFLRLQVQVVSRRPLRMRFQVCILTPRSPRTRFPLCRVGLRVAACRGEVRRGTAPVSADASDRRAARRPKDPVRLPVPVLIRCPSRMRPQVQALTLCPRPFATLRAGSLAALRAGSSGEGRMRAQVPIVRSSLPGSGILQPVQSLLHRTVSRPLWGSRVCRAGIRTLHVEMRADNSTERRGAVPRL